jgi:hypothetical protein
MSKQEGRRVQAQPPAAGERRLALAGAAVFAGLLAASIALWMRHGEEIFFSRIITAIANCF